MMNDINTMHAEAVALLKQLIAIPSFSRDEHQTALLLEDFLQLKAVPTIRVLNNVYATNLHYDVHKPTILLNSHHDTVQPNSAYTNDPFTAIERDQKIFGLGSNDAGAPLVSLLCTFLHFYARTGLKYNLIFAATGEEEISGVNGITALLPHLGHIDCAIVGEPTEMQMAIAERRFAGGRL